MGSTPYFQIINGVFNDKASDAIYTSYGACVFLSIYFDDEFCDDDGDKPVCGIFCKPVYDDENDAACHEPAGNVTCRHDVLNGCDLPIPYGRDGLFHCEPRKHPQIQKRQPLSA
jgi:hypothetical protein